MGKFFIISLWIVLIYNYNSHHHHSRQKASSLSVRYGTNQRTSSSYGDLKVKTIIQHESYDPDTIQNDISLLILSKPVVPSTNVQMIEIETDDIVDGDKVTIYGWGLTDGNGKDLPDKLQKGSMTIVGNDRCNEKWGSINAIHPGMICALDKTQSGCNVSFFVFFFMRKIRIC